MKNSILAFLTAIGIVSSATASHAIVPILVGMLLP